jgi:hypothetical protein
MRTLLPTGAALGLLAGLTVAAHAADIYAPGYGYAPAPGYGEVAPPIYQPVPGIAEAPPPTYVPLPPPVAYPVPPQYGYGAPGYGPQPGWVYSGPPVVAYGEVVEVLPPRVYRDCWWEWGQQRCAVRHSW